MNHPVTRISSYELHQLEYLVAVAEEANFTKAARRLHVAQPGVSAQIRKLERELGHELLDRSSRTVRLTEVGAAVLPHREQLSQPWLMYELRSANSPA